MASLFDGVVDRNKVWRGASVALHAPSNQAWPTKLEDVIQPAEPANPSATPYELSAGWVIFGGTTTDGITLTRGFDGQEGVAVDQLTARLFDGEPEEWRMQVSFQLLHTDPESLALGWELADPTVIAEDTTGPDYKVAQTSVLFGAPPTRTSRRLAFVQQHPSTKKLRLFVFRDGKLLPEDKQMSMSRTDPSGIPTTFACHPDTDVAVTADMFGLLYYENAS